MAREYRVNERIHASQVRVIGGNSEQLGVMSLQQARQLASEHELDLVEVAPNSDPPVCRLVDYGKLRYEYAKRDRESRKGQKNAELREVRFRPNIGPHDMESKMRKVRELIGDGSKVKITVRFRGREVAHQQMGLDLLKRVADELKEEVRLERTPVMEGRALSMILLPAPQRVERKVADLVDAKA